MTHDDVVAFFLRQQEHWQARSPEGLANGHAEEGSLVSPIFRSLHGRPAILQSYRKLFQTFPDWTYVPEQLLVDGPQVAQPFHVTATHVGPFMGLEGTGRRVEIHGVRLMEMTDGFVQHERRYYDFTALLIQLGVLRGKPARPEVSGPAAV